MKEGLHLTPWPQCRLYLCCLRKRRSYRAVFKQTCWKLNWGSWTQIWVSADVDYCNGAPYNHISKHKHCRLSPSVAHSKEVKSAAGGRLRSCSDGSRYSRRDTSSSSPMLSNPKSGETQMSVQGGKHLNRCKYLFVWFILSLTPYRTFVLIFSLEETGEHRGAAATRRTLHQEDIYSTSTAEPPLTVRVRRSLITSQEQKGGESSPPGTLKFNVIQQVTSTSFIQQQQWWKMRSGSSVERKY